MNQLRRFMFGRYGFDQFGRALIILSLVLSLLTGFLKFLPFYLIAYIPLFYAMYRILSKNTAQRMKENMLYCKQMQAFQNRMKHLKLALIGTKTHKYYSCPQCKQTIRVPRDRGKIAITCPKCKREFVKKT